VTPIETHARDYLKRLIAALEGMPMDAIDSLSETLYRAYSDGKQVFILGNGGSASTASHMAADLGKNTIGPNMRRFRIMSLNDNIPLLTALSNDLGYENMFAEQLQNLIQPGDVLIVISGSGKSPNVLRAMEYAQSRSADVIALLGFDGGPAAGLADLSVLVESNDYGVVEDAHLIINHILVEYFRGRLADEQPWSS
jgi:D-sedoheptulose 7-phosphate isomerase